MSITSPDIRRLNGLTLISSWHETGLCRDPEGFRFHQNMAIPAEFKPKEARLWLYPVEEFSASAASPGLFVSKVVSCKETDVAFIPWT